MAPSTEPETRIPVTVLTGFLGSGKTTANHGKRIAVIENEFGEVGIDDAIVKVDAEEEIFEMNNGCICCTVRGDLIRILANLAKKRNKFDMVLIETTGLADPAPVCQTFFVDVDVQSKYYLDAVLTMVDCKHLLQHLDEEKREGVENEAIEQIAFADRILVNKIDLVTKEEIDYVKTRIRGVNAVAKIFECKFGQIDLDLILGVKGFDLSRIMEMDPQFLEESEHQHDDSVTSVGIKHTGQVDQQKFQQWMSKLLTERGADIFRSKGVLSFKGQKEQYVFQAVHMLMAGSNEGEVRTEKFENRLIFIGRGLDRQELEQGFAACVA